MAFTGTEIVETERFVMFWKPPAVFSQWTPSRFEVDGVGYSHAEQFMMAEKARLFGDEAMLAKILASDDPREQKRLGQAVREFDEATWVAQRLAIVVRGNLAKFGQSERRRTLLLATGDRTLVEASPVDRIWGIGLRADHPDAQQPSRWRGLNLLGQALMAVREQLA
ncbi:MAG: NADAR family protein [Planctomycetes bacterium]|nr:NADAR family protein [Planctomycetota bacterium]